MNAENFTVLRDTYPVHPLTMKEVETKTNKELILKRKIANTIHFEK